ncbi:hypothetical protein [Arthrobacter crystallopoietes]|uniref:Uncharacterized protein n=1 Tax=Crystallibacter crystallopoietes TaxID=37928 RepID=A0A1H1CDP1_9MICC|nr:hypothetical protein [Arthrobacter crystallopoietes]AUI50775.1 hypothetical protein AC20117_08000 [Arthrobacter crystallopoietes]SDQ62337.1 hypothetical protein SAMN04489742_1873 [Arthrobacter crystallopoietes]
MTQFDDRYDPIYQRGHRVPADGRPQDLSAEPAGRIAGNGSRAANERSEAGFAAAAAPRPAPAAHPASTDLTGAAGMSEVVPPELAGRSEEQDAAPAPRSKFNPFLLALWLLGAGAIALGFWAALGPVMTMNDPFGVNSGFGPPEWIYLLSMLSPGLIGGGLTALVAALLLHSLAWQRRRG